MVIVPTRQKAAALIVAILVALSLATASPADAVPNYKTASLGSRTSSTISYAGTDNYGDRYAITATANLSSNTSTSVRVSSVKVCYSGARNSSIHVHPWIRNTSRSSIWAASGYRSFTYTSQAVCQTWSVNKTITKPSNSSHDIFRLTLNIKSAQGTYAPIFAWYR
ncbi:hypothetical protein [Demequina sp. NBRC 110053]|uniref:hypothetical protein n=1 Tax=Demequina sp. NBRC 110053 TaxID=1570342 RepID=UPI0009FCC632|nr:hypothetical protein [Demequina sp. NBRC 110053]